MKKNKIKDTGVEVTELSFGTSSLGSMPDTYGYEVPTTKSSGSVKKIFSRSGKYAWLLQEITQWGESEKRIGTAIKEMVVARKICLSTKIDRNMDTLVLDKKRTRESVEEKFKNFKHWFCRLFYFFMIPNYVKDINESN